MRKRHPKDAPSERFGLDQDPNVFGSGVRPKLPTEAAAAAVGSHQEGVAAFQFDFGAQLRDRPEREAVDADVPVESVFFVHLTVFALEEGRHQRRLLDQMTVVVYSHWQTGVAGELWRNEFGTGGHRHC